MPVKAADRLRHHSTSSRRSTRAPARAPWARRATSRARSPSAPAPATVSSRRSTSWRRRRLQGRPGDHLVEPRPQLARRLQARHHGVRRLRLGARAVADELLWGTRHPGVRRHQHGGPGRGAGDLALAECAWKLAHPGKALPAPSYWKKLLASTATDLGYPALDQSSGLVNAAAAVKAVLHGQVHARHRRGRRPALPAQLVTQRGRAAPRRAPRSRSRTPATPRRPHPQADRLRRRRRPDHHQDRHADGSGLRRLRGHHRPRRHRLRPDDGHLAVGTGRLHPHRRVRLGRQLPDLRADLRRVRPPQPVPGLAQGS